MTARDYRVSAKLGPNRLTGMVTVYVVATDAPDDPKEHEGDDHGGLVIGDNRASWIEVGDLLRIHNLGQPDCEIYRPGHRTPWYSFAAFEGASP